MVRRITNKRKKFGVMVPAKPIADGIVFLPDVLRGLTSFYTSINLRKPDGKSLYTQEEFEKLEDIQTSLLRCGACRKLIPVGKGRLYFFRRWRMIPKEVLSLGITVQFLCEGCAKLGKRIQTKVHSPQLNDVAFVIRFTKEEVPPPPQSPGLVQAVPEEAATPKEGEFSEEVYKEEEPGRPPTPPPQEEPKEGQDNTQKLEPIGKEEPKEEKKDGSSGQQVPGSPEGLEQEKRDTPRGTLQEG